jgi:hypothetical protein
MLATIQSRTFSLLHQLPKNKHINKQTNKQKQKRIYKTMILPIVLCGHETWSLTLREEHRMRVFENRMLRRIFKPKRYESAVAQHSIHQEHRILFNSTCILSTKTKYLDRIIREAIEIELHPYNMNKEEGFRLSKSWKPLICTLKYPGK